VAARRWAPPACAAGGAMMRAEASAAAQQLPRFACCGSCKGCSSGSRQGEGGLRDARLSCISCCDPAGELIHTVHLCTVKTAANVRKCSHSRLCPENRYGIGGKVQES
jgi:hypothetical protein